MICLHNNPQICLLDKDYLGLHISVMSWSAVSTSAACGVLEGVYSVWSKL